MYLIVNTCAEHGKTCRHANKGSIRNDGVVHFGLLTGFENVSLD